MPIFSDYNRTVVGYHGTMLQTALDIVQCKSPLTPTQRNDAWLGTGVYFWEHGPQQAWQWAYNRARSTGADTKNIAVVASMIRLGNCLDLLDPQNARILCKFKDHMTQFAKAQGQTMPRNARSRKYLDNAVIGYACHTLEEEGVTLDTLRAVYVPSKLKRLWKSSWMCHDTHIQLCVRNVSCILGSWLVNPMPEIAE